MRKHWNIDCLNFVGLGRVAPAIGLSLTLIGTNVAHGQNSSLLQRDLATDNAQGLTMANISWTYQRVDPPAQVKLHDLIKIIVKEASSVNSTGEMDRRKSQVYNWQLKNWIELDNTSIKLAPQRQGQPQANSTLDSQSQANGALQTKEGLNFTITAEVVDIRPNGNLVVEAHHHVKINEDIWDQSLSGIFRRQDVLPNNTVLSENIAELSIDKREVGNVRDSYRRGWLNRLYDRFMIF